MRLQLRSCDDCLNIAVRLAGCDVDVVLELRQAHSGMGAHTRTCRNALAEAKSSISKGVYFHVELCGPCPRMPKGLGQSLTLLATTGHGRKCRLGRLKKIDSTSGTL